jgi:hypothetical protein
VLISQNSKGPVRSGIKHLIYVNIKITKRKNCKLKEYLYSLLTFVVNVHVDVVRIRL